MRTFHTGGMFAAEVGDCIISPIEGIIRYDYKTDLNLIRTELDENIFFTKKTKQLTIKGNKKTFYSLNIPEGSILTAMPNTKVYDKQVLIELKDAPKKSSREYEASRSISETLTKASGEIVRISKDNLWIKEFLKLPFTSLKPTERNLNVRLLNINDSILDKKKKIPLKKKKCYNINKNDKFSLFKKSQKEGTVYVIKKINRENEEIDLDIIKHIKILNIHNPTVKIGKLLREGEMLSKKKVNVYLSQVINKSINNITVQQINNEYIPENIKVKRSKGAFLNSGIPLYKTELSKMRTDDIIQGLPKVEQLLENREISSVHGEIEHYFYNFQFVENNEISIASRKSFSKIQKILIKKIQEVYKPQGIEIANKHLEVVVRQMTSKVLIIRGGDSNIMFGEIIDINRIEKINEKLVNKAVYEPIIVGISKVALSSKSFITKACFQETTRTLCKSAIEGKIDWLNGLKENLIFGDLIPAGTGYKKPL